MTFQLNLLKNHERFIHYQIRDNKKDISLAGNFSLWIPSTSFTQFSLMISLLKNVRP